MLLCNAKTNRQKDIRRYIVVVEELNLKKLKLPVSPSPQWPRQPSSSVRPQHTTSSPATPSSPATEHPQLVQESLPKTRLFRPFPGPWQHGAFQWWQAGCCSEVAQTGYSFLLIQLLTVLSTYVQSLEHSIQGSTK
jgi:hypothetical protein